MQLLQRYYQAFNEGDTDTFLSLLHPEVVHEVSQGSTRVGRAAFGEFMQHMNRCYRERVSELCLMSSSDGQRGAAEFWLDGEYLKSDEGLPPARGQRYRLRVGAFFEIEDGLIRRFSNHYNLQDWICQVTLAG